MVTDDADMPSSRSLFREIVGKDLCVLVFLFFVEIVKRPHLMVIVCLFTGGSLRCQRNNRKIQGGASASQLRYHR